MRIAFRDLALVCLVGLVAPSLARADGDAPAPAAPAPAAPADAAEPAPLGKAESARRCVESLLAHAGKGDIDSAATFMAEPYRTSLPKMMNATKVARSADEKLMASMDAKFGEGAGKSLGIKEKKNKFMDGRYAVVEEKVEGEKTIVLARETDPAEGKKAKEETFECAKQGDFWFASPPRKQNPRGPQMTPEQEAAMADAMSAAISASATEVEGLAADVGAGKYATKEAVKPAYGAIQMKVMQAVMAAGMGAMPKPPAKGGEKPGAPEGEGREHEKGEPKKEAAPGGGN